MTRYERPEATSARPEAPVFNAHLSKSQRMADRVTEFCGSWTFIAAFSALTAGWIVFNTILVLAYRFDPYPFILFNLVLTVVSTFQSPLIMMSQNRQIERDREIVKGLHEKLDRLLAAQSAQSDARTGEKEKGGVRIRRAD